MKTVNIIGAGKLGKTIGRLLVESGLVKILGVCNRSIDSSVAAISFIGDGIPVQNIQALEPADITFITTQDDLICEISIAISREGKVRPGDVFIHCSGVLTSDVLASVKVMDGLVASCHPMKSFANPLMSVETYQGTYCAMEGDIDAMEVIIPIFQRIGSITYLIEKSKKSTYHAAGVFASNYLVTLFQESMKCLMTADVDEVMALKIVLSLMRGTLSNIERTMSSAEALTGPIRRGDVLTIQTHMSALSESKQRFLYSTLGMATLELTPHDEDTKSQIRTALQ